MVYTGSFVSKNLYLFALYQTCCTTFQNSANIWRLKWVIVHIQAIKQMHLQIKYSAPLYNVLDGDEV